MDREFEVGVFNGQYVTPVSDEYFIHVERIRGENKRMKVIEKARKAVADGLADDEEFQIAVNGAEVTNEGKVIPSRPPSDHDEESAVVNGDQSPVKLMIRKRTRTLTMEHERDPSHRQDISIHNQHDFDVDD